MRKIILLLVSPLFCLIVIAQVIDVQHYKFEIELTDASDTVNGKATVTTKFLINTPKFVLNFASPSPKKAGMSVRRVSEQGRVLTAVHAGDSLVIPLQTPAKKGERRTFEILYTGVPIDGLIVSKNKWDERTFFADNWPNRARQWLPCNDTPADKASFEFIVTAPAHYRVVSNGVRMDETFLEGNRKRTHWREEVPLPTKVMVIGAARFAVKEYPNSPDTIPVSAWVYPQDSAKGFYDYALATDILKFFSGYIGPYPYKKLANVQSKTIFGGMENASAIFYGEETVTGDRQSEALMAHEIAHQWFGDMASEKSFAHLWLSEGFATYLTNVYIENKYGKDSATKRLQADREQVIKFARTSNRAVVDSTTNLMSLLNANSYQKGGWVLHMLRREVGDAVFKKIIQTYYNQYKGSNADTRDFVAVAEKASGKKLKTFFDQWLYQAGTPQLKVQWRFSGNVVLLSVQQTDNTKFSFPLEIALVHPNGKQTIQRVLIQPDKQEYTVPVNQKPVRITLDPNTNLLFSGTIAEGK